MRDRGISGLRAKGWYQKQVTAFARSEEREAVLILRYEVQLKQDQGCIDLPVGPEYV